MEGIIVQKYPFPDYEPATRAAIINTCIKMKKYLYEHDRPCISVSGGSDSDCIVHLLCTYFPEYIEKCRFVFVDTGLEYDATRRHLHDLEMRYGITIDKIRGKSVVTVVRESGLPILNKSRTDDISYYLKGRPWAIYRIEEKKGVYGYNENMKAMIQYVKANGIKISANCCRHSKKNPFKQYMRENECDLNVTGERKAEHGQRAQAHKSCFEIHKDGLHKYMPLWWWSNTVKAAFKEMEGIRYSDCYEVYGMTRTGCCGCPFSLDIADDLQRMHEYEPQLYKACMNVFGQAYELTDRFHCRRKKCLPEFLQLTLTSEIDKNSP